MIACIFLLSLFFSIAQAATIYNFQGKLTDKTGKAVTSKTKITFRIYKTATGGTPLWTEQKEVSPDSQGRMGVKLGETSSINLASGKYYVEVQVGNETLTPRHLDDFTPPPFPTGVPLPGIKESKLGTLSRGELARLKYNSFLSDNPTVKEAIVWLGEDDRAHGSYNTWTVEMKNDLFRYIMIYETGSEYPYSEPPIPQTGSSFEHTYLTNEDEWNLYLAHVAFSLYVEVNHLVPWSIATYDLWTLQELFAYRHAYDVFGRWATDWNPNICFRFLSDRGMIRSNHSETIYAFTEWVRKYITHVIGDGTSLTAYYRYNGAPPVDRILTPRTRHRGTYALLDPNYYTVFESDIYGCIGTTHLYKAVLRSVNIPVKDTYGYPEEEGRYGGSHSRIVFPTADLAVIHSDYLHTMYFPMSFSSYTLPTSAIFVTISELESDYSSPPHSADELKRRIKRWHYRLAHDQPHDLTLFHRCLQLSGNPAYSMEEDFPSPYISDGERADLIRILDRIIEAEGGPDEYLRKYFVFQKDLHSTRP